MYIKDGITYETEEEYMYVRHGSKPEPTKGLSKKERAWLIAVIVPLIVLIALFLLIPETPPKYLPMLL